MGCYPGKKLNKTGFAVELLEDFEYTVVPSSGKRHVSESCICSRNALESLARAAYLYPQYMSPVFLGSQGAHEDDKDGKVRRYNPESQ